jgi:hypothetical protein
LILVILVFAFYASISFCQHATAVDMSGTFLPVTIRCLALDLYILLDATGT